MSLRRTLRWVPLLALTAAAACADDSQDVTSPTGSLAITTDAVALTVMQGQIATVTVTIARAGSFTNDVALSIENVPSGVTFTLNPATIAADASTATLTFSVAADAALSTSIVTIRASGTNVADATKSVDLTVVAPAASRASRTRTPSSKLALAR